MTPRPTRLSHAQDRLRELSLQKMIDYYDDWWENNYSRMVCIPPCRDLYGYLGPIDDIASNFNKDEVQKQRTNIEGNCGESLVLTAFQKCGLQQCVLINAFKSTDFINLLKKDINHQYLADRVEQEHNKKDAEYEIDYLLFHPHVGVIVFEVKSSLAEAFDTGKKQLTVRKSKLPQLYSLITGDKAANFPPMKFFLCVPEKSEGVFVDYVKSSRPDIEFELIGTECVLNQTEFKNFWEKTIVQAQSSGNNYFDSEHLRGFISAIALYRSSVWISITENILHIYDRISSHLMLEYGGDQRDKVPNYTILNKSRQQQIILSEEQMNAINSKEKCQIIYGPPGTGKTLVLLYKVLRIARKYPDSTIYISSMLNHSQEIKKFLERNEIQAHQCKIVPSRDLNKEIIKSNDHLFVDEMGKSNFTFWKYRSSCSGTTTCVVTRKSYITDSENFGREKIDHPAFEDYKEYYLQTILRGTKEIIFHWFPALRQQINERNQAKRIGNKKRNANKKRANAQTTMQIIKEFAIGHSYTGSTVAIYKELTVKDTFNRLKTELDFLFKQRGNGQQLPLSDVAILCDSNDNAMRTRAFLETNGYNNKCGSIYKQIYGNLPFLVVDDYIYALSLDWPIVISFSFLCTDTKKSFSLLANSRAIAHLVVIERDYMKIQLDLERENNGTPSNEENLASQSIFYKSLYSTGAEEDNAARCFDIGVALFRSNHLPLELYKWAQHNFAIAHCSHLCDFLEKMTENEGLFGCFAFAGRCSKYKIHFAKKKASAVGHTFKSFFNKNAKILQLLKEKPQQMTVLEIFANYWCKYIENLFKPSRIDKVQNIQYGALNKTKSAPAIWWSIITALDHFIMATSDVWFEEPY